jgi:hypothetical protein
LYELILPNFIKPANWPYTPAKLFSKVGPGLGLTVARGIVEGTVVNRLESPARRKNFPRQPIHVVCPCGKEIKLK